ncbi:MAG: DEAD/DEAH box helicase, partial [Gemmataceae bacterium]
EGGWRERPPSLADKLRLYFDATWPEAGELTTLTVWGAGELLRTYAGNFNLYVRTRDLIKQEGIIFRHLLRLILLCGEFSQVVPAGMDADAWKAELRELTDRLTASCRAVDPASTDEVIQMAKAADVVAGETPVPTPPPEAPKEPGFGAGIFD